MNSVSLSTLADNYLVMHIPREYDNLIENDKKTEILAILMEYYEALTGRQLQINFSDSITYKIKSGDNRELAFFKNESASQPILKKAGRTLKVEIASGLPKETDSTPTATFARAPRGGTSSRGATPRGSVRGGRGTTGRGSGSASASATASPRGSPSNGPTNRGGDRCRGGRGGSPRGAPSGRARGAPGQTPSGRGTARGRGGRGGGVPQPAPAKSGQPSCIALFDYDAQTGDELSFKENDVISIVHKDEGGWWEGELNRKRGWLPANYVKE